MANLENIQLSIDLLERVQAEGRPFDLADWEEPLSEPVEIITLEGVKHTCAMVCCVGGWMMHDPQHRALGFRNFMGEPAFGGASGFDALTHFWEVSFNEVEHIASRHNYCGTDPTIANVLQRLKDLHKLYS
jgi:hypothetical protein